MRSNVAHSDLFGSLHTGAKGGMHKRLSLYIMCEKPEADYVYSQDILAFVSLKQFKVTRGEDIEITDRE